MRTATATTPYSSICRCRRCRPVHRWAAFARCATAPTAPAAIRTSCAPAKCVCTHADRTTWTHWHRVSRPSAVRAAATDERRLLMSIHVNVRHRRAGRRPMRRHRSIVSACRCCDAQRPPNDRANHGDGGEVDDVVAITKTWMISIVQRSQMVWKCVLEAAGHSMLMCVVRIPSLC